MVVSNAHFRQLELVNGLDDAPSAEPENKAKRKGHVAFVTNDIADENVGSSVGTTLLDAE